eukprot:COSAG05_NODE_11472_length_511_cov_71.031553_1_plen_105_part_00
MWVQASVLVILLVVLAQCLTVPNDMLVYLKTRPASELRRFALNLGCDKQQCYAPTRSALYNVYAVSRIVSRLRQGFLASRWSAGLDGNIVFKFSSYLLETFRTV